MTDIHTSERRLLGAIGRIYDAAFDEPLWTGIAAEIAQAFDAPSMALHLRKARQGEAHLLDVTANLVLSSDAERQRAAYWRKNDLWVRRMGDLGLGRVFRNDDIYPDAVFERSGFYQDWCRANGQFYILGTVFQLPGGGTGSFGIHRPRDHRPFDETDRRHAEMLVPHYRRALEMRQRFRVAAVERQATLQALQRSDIAVLVVAPDYQVLHACPKADAMLRQADGLCIVGGRLTAKLRSEGDALRRLIDGANSWSTGRVLTLNVDDRRTDSGSLAITRPGRLPLTLLVAPLRPLALGIAEPAAIVFVRDPEAATPHGSALRDLFGLTPAEAAMAVELAQGRSLKALATSHHVSMNTVRTHLKKVLAKTNTNRQAEAVTLILGSVATVGPDAELSTGPLTADVAIQRSQE